MRPRLWVPIVLTSEEARAIVVGTKTQMRRLVPLGDLEKGKGWASLETGDCLVAREPFSPAVDRGELDQAVVYRADGERNDVPLWRNPRHLPESAVRCWLVVEAVRAEKLADIDEADALAEGVPSIQRAGQTLWLGERVVLPPVDPGRLVVHRGQLRARYTTARDALLARWAQQADITDAWVVVVTFRREAKKP